MTVIYRTSGAWGAGKGANLTPVEVDENFHDLVEQINAIIDNPVLPVEIEEITVIGNQMTFLMSDASTRGPFTIPTAAFVWKGDFIPNATYDANDLVIGNGNLYQVINSHTAGPTFIATADYAFLMPLPRVFDVGFFFPQKPGYGIPAGEPFASYLCLRDWYLIDNAPGSRARLRVAPEAELIIPIFLNTTNIGSITFEAASTTGVIAMDATQFSDNDILRLMSPTELDNTALDLMVTFKGTLGSL